MADVFLSYARADADAAMKIRTAIEALGLSVFFDTENLDSGDEWPDALDRELKAAGAVVAVWTAHALSRPWVKIECNIGKQRGILVPIQIETIDDLHKPAAFSTTQFNLLEDWDGDTDHPEWRKTVRRLAKLLGRADIVKADKRREEALRQEAESREKERKRLERLEKQNQVLKRRKGGLRAWQWVLTSVVAIGLAGGTGWYGLTYGSDTGAQTARDELRESIIPPEMQERMAQLDIENAQSVQAAVAQFFEEISLSRVIEASAVGDAQASLLAGWAHHFGEGGAVENQAEAVRFYDRSCGQGLMRGCRNLAHQYSDGEGVIEDDIEANRLYKLACDSGELSSCTSLGFQYDDGEGVAEDDVEANRLYKLACDGGDMNGCNSLGFQYDNGEGVAEDDVEANRLYKLACDSGNMSGCNNLGVQYDNGEGVAEDDLEANRLYKLACDSGNMSGCNNLGVRYANGKGVAEDDVEANRLYKLACDGGNMNGCWFLGVQYANGEGVAEDDVEANRLFKLACDGGIMTGCRNLGIQYDNGYGVVADQVEANRLFQRACDLGDEQICDYLRSNETQLNGPVDAVE